MEASPGHARLWTRSSSVRSSDDLPRAVPRRDEDELARRLCLARVASSAPPDPEGSSEARAGHSTSKAADRHPMTSIFLQTVGPSGRAGPPVYATASRPWALFLGAAIPLFVLYSATRARTVTGEDSGELITAAYQLGVARPPCYPIWVLLTKGFQVLFSGLTPADAAALGSSITTAAALGLLALVSFRLTGAVIPSLFGAWCVGVGEEIWNHGTIAEIYPLSLLFLTASILLFIRWHEAPTTRRFFTLSLVYGCGLATHPTFHLFLPVFAIAAICTKPAILKDWRTLVSSVVGLTLPHLAYIQTFIAAGNSP